MSDLCNNGISFFADGRAVPDLLTEEEAAVFLRLNEKDGPKNPGTTLKYYRDRNLLRPTRVGKYNRYLRTELLSFLDRLTKEKPESPV